MIQSFSDPETEKFFKTEKSARFAAISRIALRKLIQLNQAASLDDMTVPPGNRLEAARIIRMLAEDLTPRWQRTPSASRG